MGLNNITNHQDTLNASFNRKPLAEFVKSADKIECQIAPEWQECFARYRKSIEEALVWVDSDPRITDVLAQETPKLVDNFSELDKKYVRTYGWKAANGDNYKEAA